MLFAPLLFGHYIITYYFKEWKCFCAAQNRRNNRPTATGKTRLGVLLAKELGGEIVSADSMQIYRRMDIGTAKPTPEEMQGVPHHLIDVAEPSESWSAAKFVDAAAAACRDILSRGKLP